MKPIYKQIIKFFAFFAVTVFLFWLVYRDQNPADLMKVLREDVNYTWVWVGVVLGILSHVSRAMRWQLLTRSMGYKISFMNSFMGVMIGYFANLAIPRMGEFTRCGVVAKYEQVPFSKLLGTVVTERVFDMIMLLLLTLVVILSQFGQRRYKGKAVRFTDIRLDLGYRFFICYPVNDIDLVGSERRFFGTDT